MAAFAMNKKTRHLNIRALAVKKNPALFKRCRGRPRWQGESRLGSERDVVHIGDSPALAAYIQTHEGELQQELHQLRESARLDTLAATLIPQTNAE